MEEQLIREIKEGSRGSFKKLYASYVDGALRTATGIIRDQDLAKDAVQEAFIRVYRNLKNFDSSRPFKPWFYRIIINECSRLLRKQPKVISLDRVYGEQGYQVADKEREDYMDLYNAIGSLKDIYRVPVVLKYLHGFTEKEVAEILKLNHNTVKTRLFKARNMLRKKLKDAEGRVGFGY
ncbi:MAG: sigma-70 family RNA polymerase sigma factor [Firmicutes bacterium]|nr:sigma-70 family RNA polymerase sigma factor [Bacillota bacterium]MDD4708390.1 sigma-70 family RNA polymerase sigma factor [Bacillota bacterium]